MELVNKISTMRNSLKENWLKMVVVVIVLFGIWMLFGDKVSETRGKWQAVYYPEGCLVCEDDYIFSPFFDNANECIDWVHIKAETRGNSSDAAECSFDCKKDYDLGGALVCKETVDVLGNPSL